MRFSPPTRGLPRSVALTCPMPHAPCCAICQCHMPPCIRRTKPCSPLLSRIQGSRTVSGDATSSTAEDQYLGNNRHPQHIIISINTTCSLFDLLERKTNGRKSTPADSIVSQPHSRTRLTPPTRAVISREPPPIRTVAQHLDSDSSPEIHTYHLSHLSTHKLTPALGLTHQWAHRLTE